MPAAVAGRRSRRHLLVVAAAAPGIDVILGKPWLTEVNPAVNWASNIVTFHAHGRLHEWRPCAMSPASRAPPGARDAAPPYRIDPAATAGFLKDVLLPLQAAHSTHDTPPARAPDVRARARAAGAVLVATGGVDFREAGGAQPPTAAGLQDLDGAILAAGQPVWLSSLLLDYQDVVVKELPPGLPPPRNAVHSIETLPGSKPPHRHPYRMGIKALKELRSQLDTMLKSRRLDRAVGVALRLPRHLCQEAW